MKELIQEELVQAHQLLYQFMLNDDNLAAIEKAATIMIDSLKAGGKIIACGNGGSMCDAMHFCSELTGKYREKRKPISAIAINDPAYLTCTGNDMGYNYTFSRMIIALAKPEDVILVITTSGMSENIVMGITASEHVNKNAIVLLTSDKCPYLLQQIAGVTIKCPASKYADRIQEVHIKVLHILVMLIEKGLGYA